MNKYHNRKTFKFALRVFFPPKIAHYFLNLIAPYFTKKLKKLYIFEKTNERQNVIFY